MTQTIHWLLSRQVAYNDVDAMQDEDETSSVDAAHANVGVGDELSLVGLSLEEDPDSVGCNGRCNKRADTCYCYWVGAALKASCLKRCLAVSY